MICTGHHDGGLETNEAGQTSRSWHSILLSSTDATSEPEMRLPKERRDGSAQLDWPIGLIRAPKWHCLDAHELILHISLKHGEEGRNAKAGRRRWRLRQRRERRWRGEGRGRDVDETRRRSSPSILFFIMHPASPSAYKMAFNWRSATLPIV